MSDRIIRWATRAAYAIACLSLLYALINPLAALVNAALWLPIARGMKRGKAWPAIAAAGLQLLPLAITAGRANAWTVELGLGSAVSLAIAVTMLLAAICLWRNPAARTGAFAWIVLLVVVNGGLFSFQPFRQPTASMAPTVLAGDYFFVETASWRLGRTPRRAEIVAFRYPPDAAQTYIKRIAGVPGDRISIRDRQLYVNGQAVSEPYVAHYRSSPEETIDNFPGHGGFELPPRGRQMLARDVHDGVLVVPADHYFVLGDSRDNSLDSRFWGLVPRANIVGSPCLIYASYDLQDRPDTPTVMNLRWKRMLRLL